MTATGNTARARAKFAESPGEADPLITIEQSLDELERIADAPSYPTPFAHLNDAIGFNGLLGGQAYSLPAGTGRGKTTFVNNVAMHGDGDVLLAYYEAFSGYNVARAMAGPLGVHSNRIIREPKRYRDEIIRRWPKIYQLKSPSLATLREQTDRLSQRSGRPPRVIVDHISKLADMIQADQQRPDGRLATSQASAGLLELADATKAPVLVVSATSRVNNKRITDVRKLAPYELVDVAKESGAVEYDSAALIVLSLTSDYEGDERVATITVAKARFGTECHIDARYDGKRGTWRTVGLVEHEEAGENMKPDLREQIRFALRMSPATSGSALSKTIHRGKKAVLAMVKEMVDDGEIDDSNGLRLIGGAP